MSKLDGLTGKSMWIVDGLKRHIQLFLRLDVNNELSKTIQLGIHRFRKLWDIYKFRWLEQYRCAQFHKFKLFLNVLLFIVTCDIEYKVFYYILHV